MKKLFALVLSLMCSVSLLAGCQKEEKSTEPPKIEITAGGEEINWTVDLNIWDGNTYEHELSFDKNLEDSAEIKTVELDTEISVLFSENAPDNIQLRHCLLNLSGSQIILEKDPEVLELTEGKASFTLSKSEEINGSYLDGFKIIASWENNQCEYSFVLKPNLPDSENISEEIKTVDDLSMLEELDIKTIEIYKHLSDDETMKSVENQIDIKDIIDAFLEAELVKDYDDEEYDASAEFVYYIVYDESKFLEIKYTSIPDGEEYNGILSLNGNKYYVKADDLNQIYDYMDYPEVSVKK